VAQASVPAKSDTAGTEACATLTGFDPSPRPSRKAHLRSPFLIPSQV